MDGSGSVHQFGYARNDGDQQFCSRFRRVLKEGALAIDPVWSRRSFAFQVVQSFQSAVGNCGYFFGKRHGFLQQD